MAELRTRVYEYDFDVEGGAVGTIELTRGVGTADVDDDRVGGSIPAGAIVVASHTLIQTSLTCTATATIEVAIPGLANHADLDAVDPAGLDEDEEFYQFFTPLDITPLAADDNPQVIIATEAVTAGKIRIIVFYVA